MEDKNAFTLSLSSFRFRSSKTPKTKNNLSKNAVKVVNSIYRERCQMALSKNRAFKIEEIDLR